MNENIVSFLKKLEQDEETQKRMAACRDPEEAYQIAHAVQDGFTKEEFIEAMKALYESISQDLNAEDLVKAAGGSGSDPEEDDGTAGAISLTVCASASASIVTTVILADASIIAGTTLASAATF